jgi:RNA polymerase sigma-70 factor (ECF subfamily)
VERARRDDLQEARWIRAAGKGDTDAFGRLYTRYLGDVREFCARRIGDAIRAEDLAQDAFVRAFERMESFRPGAAFWPWISTIARNLCIDELRHRGRIREEGRQPAENGEPTPLFTDPTPDEALAGDTQRIIGAALSAAMEKLTDHDRALVWSHDVEQLSWDEVARRNRVSLDAARNSAWRARRMLRSVLAQSLSDLRSRVVLPLLVFGEYVRGMYNRARARANSTWLAAGNVASQRIAELVIAAAVVTAGVLVGQIGAGELQSAAQRAVTVRTAISKPAATSAHRSSVVTTASGPVVKADPVSLSLGSKRRPGGAGPSDAHSRIEIYGPDGTLLYWDDTTMKCGDGRTSPFMPTSGPVRAYC